ncbi:hypothetical protein GQ600_27694 [Phytophthora cactorum]|nr:hypothetical protein GQ600_27694 [Phytophthora cactorum]
MHRLQLLIQEGSTDSSKLCYLLRRLITLAESKTKAHEWFEHVLQFLDNLDVVFPELDMEWFVAKAWNIGVLCYRGNDTAEALQFLKTAQTILPPIAIQYVLFMRLIGSIERSEPLVEKLGNGLNQQFQELLRTSANSALNGTFEAHLRSAYSHIYSGIQNDSMRPHATLQPSPTQPTSLISRHESCDDTAAN